ncbi:MAG: flagellar biosynthesis anti-sigma factor FlgM [Novosphingobium sp.]|uniref:flagellar biosynthesis anti-sigma factor FlgM n=1 Tax=Novosphingobium sp. TaxID=1874826 RepID=UPI001DDB7565|nr:flagellar biosynthesis anti-sigma factor FlgM [Novosphingobium sp.]MCB2058590.1 flagellar biosynthesis anti-sigma factor FlgM [Novosphingobium sp.]MCP5385619.1 flagellar biosynthesis anti-sigma factor FlgM [Novosphingobium sp.]
MPPIEIGSGGPQAARALGAVEARIARNPAGTAKSAPAASQSPVTVSDALDPGSAPVDADRVAEIRKAIEKGTYPILPAKIADAMIAAGILLRSEK